jgi:FkbM family methyltransferase
MDSKAKEDVAAIVPPVKLRLLRALLRLMPWGRASVIRSLLPLIHPAKQRVLGVFGADELRFVADLDEYVAKNIFFHGIFEPSVTSAFQSLIQPGAVVFDVGANLGYFTLLAANRVGSSGRVVAFEPDPQSMEKLRRNLALNDFTNITVESLAVSSESGLVALRTSKPGEVNQGGATTLFDSTKQSTGSISATSTSLDAYCVDNRLDVVDVVKMDIEGGEYAAVEGMQEGMRNGRYRSIVLELHPEHLRASGRRPEWILETLHSHGYRGWRVVSRPSFAKYPMRLGKLRSHRLEPWQAGDLVPDNISCHFMFALEGYVPIKDCADDTR